jgi:hypothetical protein
MTLGVITLEYGTSTTHLTDMELYHTLYYSIYYTLVVRGHRGARGGVYSGVCHAEYGAGIDARLCCHLSQACQQLVKHVSS